jgi:hypothetical protein
MLHGSQKHSAHTKAQRFEWLILFININWTFDIYVRNIAYKAVPINRRLNENKIRRAKADSKINTEGRIKARENLPKQSA